MYSSRGSGAYGQQPYGAGQQPYGQNSASAYAGNSIGAEGVARHSAMLGGSQDADNIATFRAAAAQYGGQYGSVYGSSTLGGVQQAGTMGGKVAGSSALQGDYVSSSSHGYGQKSDQFPGKIPDYPSLERRNYGDHQSPYLGRDVPSETTRRYAESAGLGTQHQPEMYDHIDQASLLRQQQMLKSQALQSASLDGTSRPADYLAARGAAMRHATQDLASYGGRMDADPRNLSMLGSASYAQHQASILGAAPRRAVEDLMYSQGSTAGYGVSLPPGRDYAAGKGLRGASLENEYPGSLLSRGGSRIDDRKDDRGTFRRDLDTREEERRRREREKDREREKERDRERERKRERERRDKERERERKRVPDIRREPTPPRTARDRHGSSLTKDDRSLRRDSPRHDAVHRRHSPVREKRREYVCKVYPSSLVEVERDYLSIFKRYPNLSVSPEFSKIVVNWPKGNLKLSFHTPVSFEHDVVELESKDEQKKPSSEPLSEESGQSRNIVWNAKVILMSGLSKTALDDLASDKSFDDRIPHVNNILRFAFLRKDRSFMAIGGPWDVVDGGDPSVDESSLVQTALRHAKDSVQLDLSSCQQWNRFLEIHYDRVGKDGLFSHKEITVLFIPDLSDCLPTLNVWRDQWLAHRKSVTEKERRISSNREKSTEKDGVVKGDTKSAKNAESSKTAKVDGKALKKEKDPQGKLSDRSGDGKKSSGDGGSDQNNDSEKQKLKDEVDGDMEKKQADEKETETTNAVEVQKPGKKKVLKKVLKQKVVDKKTDGGNSANKGNEKLDEKNVVDKEGQAEVSQHNEVSAEPSGAKTSAKKKIVKKVPVGKVAKKDNKATDADIQKEGTPEKVQEEKLKGKIDSESAVVPEGGAKTTTKKKIIKRVAKKKANADGKGAVADSKNDLGKDENGCGTEKTKEETEDTGTPSLGGKTEKKDSSKTTPKVKKEDDSASKTEKEIKDTKGKIEGKGIDAKKDSGTKTEIEIAKEKGSNKDSRNDKKDKLKDEKDKKDKLKDEKDKKDRKDESRHKSAKEARDKAKAEEPPQHPGFILQTKRTKESKIRSMALSLDSLLDYNDKDIEESTFELSLFAESMYEMLQYQMGCRLLAFLQNLRLNFVNKRNLRKRQREENPKKESENENSKKRLKTEGEASKENDSAKSEKLDAANEDKEQSLSKDDASEDENEESKMGDESDEYDPEEDVDEDQEMDENEPSEEAEQEQEETGAETKPDVEMTEQKDDTKVSSEKEGISNVEEVKDKAAEVATKEKASTGKELTVDKELLQAFRFFDRNRVGYIKVEDMRFILHNLGKFLSHRDVKELVQSALLESNTARDNRILYTKLVKS